jgi:hypothetical protein
MNPYAFYVGIFMIVFVIYKYYRGKSILANGEVIEAKVIKVKNKTNKGKRYCYPKLYLEDSGNPYEFYCYSAKTSGHDIYHEGQLLKVRRFNKLFGGIGYFYGAQMKLDFGVAITVGLILVIASFFV